jgi:hypothetical protein
MARPGDFLSNEEVQLQLDNLRRLRSQRLDRAGEIEEINDLIADIMNQLEVLYVAVNGSGTKPQVAVPDGFYPASPSRHE